MERKGADNVPLCPTASVDKLMNSNVNVPKVLVLPVVKAKHIRNLYTIHPCHIFCADSPDGSDGSVIETADTEASFITAS